MNSEFSFHFIVLGIVCHFLHIDLFGCRFEKLQEDAFTYTFILKVLNKIRQSA